MADSQAGKRYAQAAFGIARDSGTIAVWRSDLADIASVLAASPVSSILADTKIALSERLEMTAKILDIAPPALNLAKLLIQKGRSLDAGAVATAFTRFADEFEGIAKATVTTAVAISAEQLAAIEAQLSQSLGRRVQATPAVDPALVGGVVVRIGDQIVDGSIRTRLQSLRRELQGAS